MTFKLKGDIRTRRVWINDKELTPHRSQKIRNHSPDGFNWGYHGSGPSQLSLAITLELFNDSRNYFKLKEDVISQLPQTSFELVCSVHEQDYI